MHNMGLNFFLDGVFDPSISCPGTVRMWIPVWNGSSGSSSYAKLAGLLASEPNISTQNKWGPLLSDVSNLSKVSAWMGDDQVFGWIGASVQCWKGTEPLRLSLDFYMINYSPNLNLETMIKNLVKLTSLGQATGALKDVKVAPHGGYAAKLQETNTGMFEAVFNADVQNYAKQGEVLFNYGDIDGTVILQIGTRMTYKNLLVSRVNVTPSLVEVCGSDTDSPKPLYYRVSVDFIGTKVLLSTDVDNMF